MKKSFELNSAVENNRLIMIAATLIVSLSSIFTFAHITSHGEPLFRFLGMFVGAGLIGGLCFYKYSNLLAKMKNCPGMMAAAVVLGVAFSYGAYKISGFNVTGISPLFGSKLSYVFGLPSAVAIAGICIYIIKSLVLDLRKRIDKVDFKICVAAEIVFILVMLGLLSSNPQWYMQYDMVYSMDTGWYLSNILANVEYNDVRHPLFTLLTFPVWATIVGVAKLTTPPQVQYLFSVLLLQILAISSLMLIGAMLKALTNKRSVLILYLASFSTLISAVSPEKYVISALFVVGTIYSMANFKRFAPVGYALSIGVLPTNAFLFLIEFLSKDLIKVRLKRLLCAAALLVLLIICSGHGDLLNLPGTIAQMKAMHTGFVPEEFSFEGRIISTLNVFQGSLLPVTAGVVDGHYVWTSLVSSIEPIGLLIFLFMLLGFFSNRGRLIVKAAGLWIVLAFVLFVAFSWVPYESVLFAPLFSWAVVCLFCEGMEFVSEKLVFQAEWAVGLIAAVCFGAGVAELFNINAFLLGLVA